MAVRKTRKRTAPARKAKAPPRMPKVAGNGEADPAALASGILEEEAKRQAEQEERGKEEVVIADDLLPGVGGEPVPFRQILRRGGVSTIAVLFALNFMDEFDRVAFGLLAPDIQHSLRISTSLLAIGGSLGGVLVFAAAIPMGYLADRVRRVSLVGIFSAMWAFFSALTGLAQNAWQLLTAQTLGGIGKANVGTVQAPLLADAYPIEGRTRIFAIHDAANPVGYVIAPLVVGGIAVLAGGLNGWRWAFILTSPPAVLFAIFAFFLREPKRGRNERLAIFGEEADAEATEELRISLSAAFGRLRKIKTFYYFLVALGAIGFGFNTVPIFYNLILEERFGLDAWGRGLVGTITAAGTVAGTIIGGRYGDRLFRQAPEKTVLLCGLAVTSYGVTLPVQVYMPNIYVFIAIGLFTSALTAAAFVPSSGIIAAVTPFRLRSLGFATIGIYMTLIGGVGGAIIAGGISDALGPQAAIAILVPIAAFLGGGLIIYGARFVRSDMALTVADLKEEQAEVERVASGAAIPTLQVSRLDYSYGHVQVLFDVTFEVKEGETLALLGTNGAGKSTLLRAISGLGIPDRGAVRLDGRTITYVDPVTRVKLGIVQVPGGRAVFPSLTVAENLTVGAHTYIWDREKVNERVDRVIELFPVIGERLDQMAGTLSGGEQQMLALGRAMLLDPKLLLIDELSLGLAPVVVQELLGAVERLKAQGITMIIVEQSVNVALSLADRALFMEKGRIRFEGPAAELLERDDLVRAVFLGGEGG
jgi:ABC-type branched-subunit amino acid transport system ATPase component/predicted MFS family arabinose efflux permease